MSSTPDLFGAPDASERLLRMKALFEEWIIERDAGPANAGKGYGPLRAQSAEVYRDMWGYFAQWCVRHERNLVTLDEVGLDTFLQTLGGAQEATPRYTNRMLQLLARVDRQNARNEGRAPSPAIAAVRNRALYRFASARSEDPLPEFLTSREARLLVDFSTAPPAGRNGLNRLDWHEVRNRTAVAVQLGSGITPGEARTLTLSQVVTVGGRIKDEPWALALPGNGNFAARQTPLANWAGRQLKTWLVIRAEQAIPGDWVFPGTRSGTEWSKASSINSFRDVLNVAGMASTHGGSFKLRHTFALRQLTRHPPETVAAWLGVHDPAIMERYRRVLFQPVDVV